MGVNRNLGLACFFAPLSVVPLIVLWGMGTSDSGFLTDFFIGIIMSLIVGLPIAYAGMLLIGVPTYLILNKFRLVRMWNLAFIGFIVPYIFQFGGTRIDITLLVSFGGMVIAISAYFLLRAK